MRQSVGTSVTRYDICELVCKVYEKSLNPSNLRAAFKKTGIYPLSPNEIDIASTVPSVVYKGKSFLQSQLNTIHDSNENNNADNNDAIEKRADESIFFY